MGPGWGPETQDSPTLRPQHPQEEPPLSDPLQSTAWRRRSPNSRGSDACFPN